MVVAESSIISIEPKGPEGVKSKAEDPSDNIFLMSFAFPKPRTS